MVDEVGADGGQVGDCRDVQRGELGRGTDAAEEQELRRVGCAGGEDYFVAGVYGEAPG